MIDRAAIEDFNPRAIFQPLGRENFTTKNHRLTFEGIRHGFDLSECHGGYICVCIGGRRTCTEGETEA